MFRADAVPLDRYPEARKQEDEAFGKLVKEIGKTFASQPPEERRRWRPGPWSTGLRPSFWKGALRVRSAYRSCSKSDSRMR